MGNTEVVMVPEKVAKDSTNPNNRIKARGTTIDGLKEYQKNHGMKVPAEVPVSPEERTTQIEPSKIFEVRQAVRNLKEKLNIKDWTKEIVVYDNVPVTIHSSAPLKVTDKEPKYMYTHIRENAEELKKPEESVAEQVPEATQEENMVVEPVTIAPQEDVVPVKVTPEAVEEAVGNPDITITPEEKAAIAEEADAEMAKAEMEAELEAINEELRAEAEAQAEKKLEEEQPNMFSVIDPEEAKEEVQETPEMPMAEESHDSKVGEMLSKYREVRALFEVSIADLEAKKRAKEEAERALRASEATLEETVRALSEKVEAYAEETRKTELETEREVETAEELARRTVENEAAISAMREAMGQSEESPEASAVR